MANVFKPKKDLSLKAKCTTTACAEWENCPSKTEIFMWALFTRTSTKEKANLFPKAQALSTTETSEMDSAGGTAFNNCQMI